jgi:tRNA-2-methylthio-N6-dimethylallyladenosine synthase
LKDRGFIATANPQEADAILMNTCTVRDQAEHRAQSNLGRLREWKAEDPNRVLIVAGCAASLWGRSIQKRYPYIDLVAPATQIEKFPDIGAAVLKDRWNEQAENAIGFSGIRGQGPGINDQPPADSGPRPADFNLFGNGQTAYVTIMRGCNYNCSYCIVPQVRGREVYRSPEEILNQVQSKVSEGLEEVMLLGQTVNSYYWKMPDGTSWDFADLLRAVNCVEGVKRLRFMSPHPRHMRDRVIQAMRESTAVCRHIHLPLQSGSTSLLQRMNRLYTRADYLAIIQKLRDAMPGIMITTDIIVGFPGETDDEFHDTLSIMEEAAFDGLFAFKFSPRPDTVAGALPDDVTAELKEKRLQTVLDLNKRIQHSKPQRTYPLGA